MMGGEETEKTGELRGKFVLERGHFPSEVLLMRGVLLLLAGLGGCAAAPAYAPFTPFSNFSLRTDLCPDAARLSRGEVIDCQ